jgi:hypothetical protein
MNEDQKIDEAFLGEMMKRGEKAWRDVSDVNAWVEELRNGTLNQTYQPECWLVQKDTIYAAYDALKTGLENTQELLCLHDQNLGRTTKSNRMTAEQLEFEIENMKTIIEKLKQPDL